MTTKANSRMVDGGPINVMDYGATGDGVTDDWDAINLAFIAGVATGKAVYFPAGVYNVVNKNFPKQADFGGIVIYGDGRKSILKTTSVTGADVLQLNVVANVTFRDLAITATLTGLLGAGSNGISMTNGCQNISLFNIHCFDLPYVDQGTFGDGGKAFTLQTGILTTRANKNIKIVSCSAVNCLYGYGMDAPFDHAANSSYFQGIDIDIFTERCYRGIVLSLAGPVIAIGTAGATISHKIRHTSLNCQQDVVLGRAWGVQYDGVILKSEPSNAHDGWLTNDTKVLPMDIISARLCQIKANVRVTDVDSILRTGGGTFSDPGANYTGRTQQCQFEITADYSIVRNAEIEIVNAGGLTVEKSKFEINGFDTPTTLELTGQNHIIRNGIETNQNSIVVNQFEVQKTTGVSSFKITDSGQLHVAATSSAPLDSTYINKIAIYNPVTGALFGFVGIYLDP